jgi:hypothetical protein
VSAGLSSEFAPENAPIDLKHDPTDVVHVLLIPGSRECSMKLESIARRVLAEFEEMPGLMLTRHQASKLFGLEPEMCRIVLDSLVDLAYLRQTSSGSVTLGDRVAA